MSRRRISQSDPRVSTPETDVTRYGECSHGFDPLTALRQHIEMMGRSPGNILGPFRAMIGAMTVDGSGTGIADLLVALTGLRSTVSGRACFGPRSR